MINNKRKEEINGEKNIFVFNSEYYVKSHDSFPLKY